MGNKTIVDADAAIEILESFESFQENTRITFLINGVWERYTGNKRYTRYDYGLRWLFTSDCKDGPFHFTCKKLIDLETDDINNF